MALFFNLKTLESQANGDVEHFMAMLKHHYDKRTLPARWQKYQPSKVPLHGNSFILNPFPLFKDEVTDILYKVQYVKLAARRDFTLYKQYNYKHLQTSYFPDLNIQAIKSNPLLTITPTEIQFKYEI